MSIRILQLNLKTSKTLEKKNLKSNHENPFQKELNLLGEAHIPKFVLKIIRNLRDEGFEAYLVGGCIRDILTGLKPKDFDIATAATPEEVRKTFKASRIIGKRFKLVHVYQKNTIIEVATFRKDVSGDNFDPDLVKDDAGKIIRDNVWGSLQDDCKRRDFSINAIYYCPLTQKIFDEHNGIKDIANKKIVSIGDPQKRFEEDPVRSIRAIRFAAKLNFKLDKAVKNAIYDKGILLQHISNARMFDEFNKLFLTGWGEKTFQKLKNFDLHKYLLSTSKTSTHDRLLNQTFINTDSRYHADKSITPGFLIAALLWPKLLEKCVKDNSINIRLFFRSMDHVLREQQKRTAVPRKFSSYIKDIWYLQLKLSDRFRNNPKKIIKHPRFRAGYDFLLIREIASRDKSKLGVWWTKFQKLDSEGQDRMLKQLKSPSVLESFRKQKPKDKPFGFSEELG